MEITMNKQFHRTSFPSTLPLIKEEETHSGEDIPQFTLYKTNVSPHVYAKMNNSKSVPNNVHHFSQKWKPKDDLKELTTCPKKQISPHYPYHLHINCLINPNMKQSCHIWETILAKRLLKVQHPSIHNQIKEEQFPFNCNNKWAQFEHLQSGDPQGGETLWKPDFIRIYNKSSPTQDVNSNKSVRLCGSNLNLKNRRKTSVIRRRVKRRRINGVKMRDQSGMIGSQEEETPPFKRDESRGIQGEKNKVHFMGSNENSLIPLSTSTISSVRRIAESVRAIFDNTVDTLICSHCGETFEKVPDLVRHKKCHEKARPVCVICDQSFATTGDLIHHLSLHEGVDKFSCKKCKKYFPSSQKYRKHVQDVHSRDYKFSSIFMRSEETSDLCKHIQHTCPRCKEVFHQEDEYQNHKKLHVNTDLATASLLCSEFVNFFSFQ